MLQGIEPGTIANAEIKNWRSRLRGSIVRMLDDIPITSPSQFKAVLREKRRANKHHATRIKIQFAHPKWSDMNGEGLPTMAFDQLNVVAHHLNAIENNLEHSWDPETAWPPIRDEDIQSVIHKGLALPKLTRKRLKAESEDWPQFLESEWVQLDKYHNQGMFGDPVPRPRNAVVLPWVWAYVYKTDPVTLQSTPKSRGTCNGGKRHGKIVTLAETYAACVDQPAHRLTWAIIAALNYVALGTDVGNALAEADGPEDTFYMYVDEQFHDWWTQHLGHPPVPHGHVIPIRKNLQGHPEGPRLWNKYIDKLLTEKMHFKPTTHEPCLYHKRDANGNLILILRQVDDFLIAGPTLDDCQQIRNQIAGMMTNAMNDLGVIKRFNGVDIDQTRDYIKLSCETYIDKIVSHHGWTNEKCREFPIPMRNDSTSLTEIQTSTGPTDPKLCKELEKQMGFNYRQAIGELIFAMSTCRVDIASAVIQLSQHAANPAKCHYQAAKQIFIYLNATKDHGLFYWRSAPYQSLPRKPKPTTYTKLERLQEFPSTESADTLHGYSDATWANDKLHRRSVSGTAILLSGAVVYYRCQLQPTIALSSTEAEFAAMAETGKAALYLRSILDELGILQSLPTNIYADNAGAICIAQAQQPTRRTKHVEIKQFAILQWTEQGYLNFKATPTQLNASDSLTKPLGRIKFYEQNETLMGRIPPLYTATTHTITSCSTPRIFSILMPDDLLDPFPNPIFDPSLIESAFS